MPALRSPLRPAIRSALRSPLDPAISSGGGPIPDYYVSNNGSDTNDGSLEAPFATLAKAATVLANGKTIGLARGSMWRESLDFTSYTGVTIMGYGSKTLPLPRVDGTSIVASGEWAKTAGKTNVYQCSVAHTVNNGYAAFWEDLAQMLPVADTTVCDATPGSFVVSGYLASPGTITMYINASSGIPTTNGKLYEVACRDVNLQCGFAAGSVKDVWVSRPAANNGGIVARHISGCLSTEGSKHNLFVSLSGDMTGNVCYRTTDGAKVGYGGSAMIVGFGTAVTTERTRFKNNYVYAEGLAARGTQALLTHTGDASLYGGADIEGFFAYYMSNGLAVGAGINNTIKNVFVERVETLFENGGTSSYENVVWLVDSVAGNCIGNNPAMFNGCGLTYAKNLGVYADATPVGKGITYLSPNGSTFEQVSYYKGGGSFKFFGGGAADSTAIALTNSVLYNCDSLAQFYAANADFVGNARNIFYRSSGAMDVVLKGVTYANFAAYKAARTTLDQDSVDVDPLFVGTPATGDFSLSASSPANALFAARVGYQPVAGFGRPNWAALKARWDFGFLGIDGT